MRRTSLARHPQRGLSGFRTVGLGLLCVALSAGFALAQSGPTPSPKKDSPKTEAGDKAGEVDKKSGFSKTSAPRKKTKSRRNPNYKMDPNAKWSCEKSIIEEPPVWRNSGKLTFSFHIRNEGTADLQIKAAGG